MRHSIDPSHASREAILSPWVWLGLLTVTAIGRLLVGANHPLFETETYYWMYSRNMALGYFDHPPMLAAFIRLFDFFEPPSSLAARLHSVVGSFFSSLFIYGFARNLFGSKTVGIRAALLFNVIPIYSILAIQNQPDSPLIFFWTATMFCFERSVATGKPAWWLLAGIAAGGALLSKFHAVILVGSLVLYLITSSKDRRHLLTPWPYFAMALAVALYAPNFWWNARNGWITYNFQLFDHAQSSEFKPIHVVGVLLAPFLLLSPWVYGFFVKTAARASKNCFAGNDRRLCLSFWSSLPLFLFFMFVSLSTTVKIHWTTPVFIGLLPLMAEGLGRWTRRNRTLFVGSSGAVTALVYLFLLHPYSVSLTLPNSWVPGPIQKMAARHVDLDWAAYNFGFDQLGAFLRSKIEESNGEEFDLIESQRFDRASSAAFYAGYPDRAFVPPNGDRRGFILWPSKLAKAGANALYVDTENSSANRSHEEVAKLHENYRTVGEPYEVEALFEGHPLRRFLVYPCYGLKQEALALVNGPQ